MSDAELLRRFVESGSQESFGELVGRHVNWVAAAARRRVGGDSHLADDVTQAVFILLAKKARTLRRETVLSAWLFQAVRYCALEALRARRRQQHRDEQAALIMRQQQQAQINEGSPWTDLAPQLDELVAKLGGTDRRAVLLRFYEQKTFGEVGRTLGISEEAARKRVNRAVEKLSALFRRRGITVGSAALAATLITSVTPASAPAATTLASAALAAVGGASNVPSAALVAHGAAGMMAWAQLQAAMIVIVASLAAVSAGGGAIVLVAQLRAAAPSPATAPAGQQQLQGQPPRFVTGRVLTPDEKPVGGAKLMLVADDSAHSPHAVATADSAADGTFRIQFPADAAASGLVVDAAPWAFTSAYPTTDRAVDVVVRPPTQVQLTVLAPDGKPAADVEIAPAMAAGGGVMVEQWWSISFPQELSRQLARRTDAAGRVTLSRMPQKSRLRLDVNDDRFARPGYKDEFTVAAAPQSTIAQPLQLAAAATVSGRVTFPDGKPAANVGIGAQTTDADGGGGWGGAVTDANGAYRVTRLHAGSYNVIVDLPKDLAESWTAVARENVKLVAAENLDGVDLHLITGTTIHGKVTGKPDGAPIAELLIGAYGPARPRSGGAVHFANTAADGSYSIRVPPGPHYVYIGSTPPEGYGKPDNAQREITVGDGGATVDFQLPRAPGKPVSGVVLGPDGKPVPRAWVSAQHNDDDGMFPAHGVAADENGRFAFKALRSGSKLRATGDRLRSPQPVSVRGGESDLVLRVEKPVMAKLAVRVVDPAGKPIPTARVSLMTMMGRMGIGSSPQQVDAQGTYTYEDLRPDQSYSISALALHFGRGNSAGEIKFKPGQAVLELPAITLKPANSIVTGSVVDEHGASLADVQVKLEGRDTVHQHVKTDAQGRFEFGDVVDGETVQISVRRGEVYHNSTPVAAGTVNVVITAPAAATK